MEEIAKPQENKEYPDTLKDGTIPYCRKSHVLGAVDITCRNCQINLNN